MKGDCYGKQKQEFIKKVLKFQTGYVPANRVQTSLEFFPTPMAKPSNNECRERAKIVKRSRIGLSEYVLKFVNLAEDNFAGFTAEVSSGE